MECAITLKRYVDNVEQPYLKFTSEHYAKKSESVSEYSPLEYLKMCVKDVAREEQAGKGVLREETVRMAGLAALQKLVTPHVEILTGDGESSLITQVEQVANHIRSPQRHYHHARQGSTGKVA